MRVARSHPRFARLTGVTFDAYLRMRDDPGNLGNRMAYHDGVLEHISPDVAHDKGTRNLLYVVAAYCRAFAVPSRAVGSTTFRRGWPGELRGDGKEPDESFYLGADVARIAGKTSVDLEVDPPPSLWIEVDNWGGSASKFPLYAGLGVPEVWRYRARPRRLWFGRLDGGLYRKLAASAALPGLSSEMVLGLLDEYQNTWDATRWSTWLETVWFPEHRQQLIDAGAGRG
ncbi:MAG: Uma2 family endonuclease [Isosphaeraceae bacterium]